MGQSWDDLYERYNEYSERFPNEGIIKGPEGSELPLQSAARGDPVFGSVKNNEGSLERELLLEHSGSLPSVRELDPEICMKMPLGLTEVLRVQISNDHKEYWIYTLESLRGSDNKSLNEDIVGQIEYLIALILSSSPYIGQSLERWSDEWAQDLVLSGSGTIGSYVAYPTLEGVIKSICSRDYYPDGTVKEDRTVQTLPPGTSVTGDEKESVQINSVGDLLWHFESTVADNSLKQVMKSMRDHVATFYDWDVDEVYGRSGLSGQRNSWLHGEEQALAEFGITMNYISLLIWGLLTDSLSDW